jgi:hypothetical protein
VPHHEDVWGSEGVAVIFLTYTYMEVSGQLHASAALLSGKQFQVPTVQGVGWDPEAVWIYISVSWVGVRLSPIGTSATTWPFVPAPDDT